MPLAPVPPCPAGNPVQDARLTPICRHGTGGMLPQPLAGEPPPQDGPPEAQLAEGFFGVDENGDPVAAWVTGFPFLANRVFLRQTWWLLGFPLALCWAALAYHALFREPPAGQVTVGVIVLSVITGLVLLAILIVAWAHRWRHEELYILSRRGVSRRYTGETGDRLQSMLGAATLGGIELDNWSMAGTALMAASRVSEEWAWEGVRKMSSRPGRPGKGYHKLWGGIFRMQGLWLFTSLANHERVAAVARHYLGRQKTA